MPVVRRARQAALALGLIASFMALYCNTATRRFVAAAHHADGHVIVPSTPSGESVIVFQADDATQHRLTVTDKPTSAVIPLLYVRKPIGIDARLASDRKLWASMWAWIEAAFAAFLVAIYLRALVEDPLSVIGFKSWRLKHRV